MTESTAYRIAARKNASITRLPTGYYRVGEGTHSIVRTLTTAQMIQWAEATVNWTSFRPTPD